MQQQQWRRRRPPLRRHHRFSRCRPPPSLPPQRWPGPRRAPPSRPSPLTLIVRAQRAGAGVVPRLSHLPRRSRGGKQRKWTNMRRSPWAPSLTRSVPSSSNPLSAVAPERNEATSPHASPPPPPPPREMVSPGAEAGPRSTRGGSKRSRGKNPQGGKVQRLRALKSPRSGEVSQLPRTRHVLFPQHKTPRIPAPGPPRGGVAPPGGRARSCCSLSGDAASGLCHQPPQGDSRPSPQPKTQPWLRSWIAAVGTAPGRLGQRVVWAGSLPSCVRAIPKPLLSERPLSRAWQAGQSMNFLPLAFSTSSADC